MKIFKIITLIAVCVLISCKNHVKSDKQDLLSGKYGIKKAIVTTQISIPGFSKMEIQLLFDDYGKLHKQITNNVSNSGLGNDLTLFSLIQGDYIYTWDDTKNIGTKIHLSANEEDIFNTGFDFKKINDDFKEKYQLKKIGSKIIIDKNTTIYSLVINGSKLKYYVWENIPLAFNIELEDRTIQSELISINENPKFDKITFEIPKDIIFEEAAQETIDILNH